MLSCEFIIIIWARDHLTFIVGSEYHRHSDCSNSIHSTLGQSLITRCNYTFEQKWMQNIRNFIMFLRLKRLNLNHIKNWIQWKLHVFGDNSLKGRCVLRNRLWHQNVTSITLSFEQKLQCTLFFSTGNSIHCVIDSSLNNLILPMITHWICSALHYK